MVASSDIRQSRSNCDPVDEVFHIADRLQSLAYCRKARGYILQSYGIRNRFSKIYSRRMFTTVFTM